ncbi:MAG: preprotein translocase subunit SecG [Gloeobacteraceae cyanobacterium ES-bin-144]|nr:preprotein translocase subunit SecG [Verrucomicrobiales bacterium]
MADRAEAPSVALSAGFPAKTAPKNPGNSPLYKPHYATHSPAPMTFAAIDWLNISINLLLVIFVIVCLLMTLLILMQRPKQEGLGAAFGAGVTDQVFGARTTNVLQRGTVYLGSMFFILALILAVLIGHKNQTASLLAPKKPAAEKQETKTEKPAEPVLPKSLSEELPVETVPPVETPAPPLESAPTPPQAPPVESTPAPSETAPTSGDSPVKP